MVSSIFGKMKIIHVKKSFITVSSINHLVISKLWSDWGRKGGDLVDSMPKCKLGI